VYGASLSKDTVSRITGRLIEDVQAWSSAVAAGVRGGLYRRDHGQCPGRAGRQPAVLGRDRGGPGRAPGQRSWAGTSGGRESAKFWMAVLTDIENRGVADVFFIVCDGPVDLPD
jgi:transposase-like protein